MKFHAVIGTGFGDEGKGLMTDYLVRRYIAMGKTVLVCRHSGGAQAAHTVETENQRHVFSHFGSGTLAGAPTYLGRNFVLDPMRAIHEHAELSSKVRGPLPLQMVDIGATAMLPVDAAINVALEELRGGVRGEGRHGSCGMGINEAMRRRKAYKRVYVSDMLLHNHLERIIRSIYDEYVPARLAEVGISEDDPLVRQAFDEEVLEGTVRAYYTWANSVHIASVPDMNRYDVVVFEGSQGLLLHQDHKFFPHVTHAKTGVENMMWYVGMASHPEVKDISVTYVTRAYMTRHGDGPFPTWDKQMTFQDETNAPNPWQGAIRFGHLDLDLILPAITEDRAHLPPRAKVSVAVTCLDQADQFGIKVAEQLTYHPKADIYDVVSKAIGVDELGYCSYGPTSIDVH